MTNTLAHRAVCFALLAHASSATASPPRPLSVDQAREIVQPLYDALNEPSKKDVAGLLARSTTADFRSCANDDECGDRAYLAARFERFGKIIPTCGGRSRTSG